MTCRNIICTTVPTNCNNLKQGNRHRARTSLHATNYSLLLPPPPPPPPRPPRGREKNVFSSILSSRCFTSITTTSGEPSSAASSESRAFAVLFGVFSFRRSTLPSSKSTFCLSSLPWSIFAWSSKVAWLKTRAIGFGWFRTFSTHMSCLLTVKTSCKWKRIFQPWTVLCLPGCKFNYLVNSHRCPIERRHFAVHRVRYELKDRTDRERCTRRGQYLQMC